jgi:hypothetical protein
MLKIVSRTHRNVTLYIHRLSWSKFFLAYPIEGSGIINTYGTEFPLQSGVQLPCPTVISSLLES